MPESSKRNARISPRLRGQSAVFLAAAATLVASATEAQAATFIKGPYLQSLGQEGVTIQLELDEPGPASIEIEGPDGLKRAVASTAPAESRFHAVRVEGLQPATSYGYVAIAGSVKSEQGRFTTAPPDDRPFTFILYGDSRSDHAAHAAVMRAIEAVPSDFLLHTGDMVYMGDSEADWQAFFDAENTLLRDRCVFVAVGNHELAGTAPVGEPIFLRYFGGGLPGASAGGAPAGGAEPSGSPPSSAPLYRSFRWSNTRFFLLNAMDSWDGQERRWLRDELERAVGEPGILHRVAVLHHGPFSSGPHGANTRLADGGVIGILRDHRVDLVVAGHDHIYERGEGEGLKYIVSGGAGAPLYKQKSASSAARAFESVHHFVEVAVSGDTIEIVARRASGGIIERCSFQGTGSWACGDDASGRPQSPAQGSSCGCEVPGRPSATGDGAFKEGRASSPLLWASICSAALVVLRVRQRSGGLSAPFSAAGSRKA